MENKTQPDLQALALTKAIRQVESGGNYKAVGDVGTSTGAYQYQPATWKAYSKEVLGIDNAPMTEENQNAVTYAKVKQWKDAGLGPAEIAGKWNSGSERGWENKVGTTTINGQQVSYNTPKYAQDVVGAFKQIYPQEQLRFGGQQTQQATPTPEQPEQKNFFQKVGDFFTGSTQKFGKTIGEALAAPANAKLYEDQVIQHTNNVNQLQSAIYNAKKVGADTTRLEKALQNELNNAPKLEDFTGNVINKTPEQVVGEGVGTGLEALSGGILESAGKTLTNQGLSLGQKLTAGAKIGGTYGAVGGASNAMQNNESAPNVLGEATVGGVLGAGLGVGAEAVGSGIGKVAGAIDKSGIINKILPETEARIKKQEGWVSQARENMAKSFEESLPLTPTEKMKEARALQKTGDNVFTTLAKHNISVGTDKAIPELQAVSDLYDNAINFAKENEHAYFNINELKNNAYNEINKYTNSATERAAAKLKVDREIASILKESGKDVIKTTDGQTKVKVDVVERLRMTGNDWGQYNKLNPDTIKNAAGRGLANAVRDQIEKDGSFAGYRTAMKEWGKIIHAQEVLQRIEDSGKQFKILGGLSGAIARRILSGVIGLHSGGIGGAILSEMGAEYAAKILSNPELKTYFDRKLIEKFGNKKITEKARMELEQEVIDHINQSNYNANVFGLPEPSPIGTTKNPIITPAPTTYEKPAGKIMNESFIPKPNNLPRLNAPGQNPILLPGKKQ